MGCVTVDHHFSDCDRHSRSAIAVRAAISGGMGHDPKRRASNLIRRIVTHVCFSNYREEKFDTLRPQKSWLIVLERLGRLTGKGFQVGVRVRGLTLRA